MARRPLPRILSTGSAQIARSRELARTAADSATDVLHPLITITRGLRRLAAAGRRKWADTPKDRRGPLLFLVASVVLVVALVPYGPLLAVITLMAAAAWQGRDRTPPEPDRARRVADPAAAVAVRSARPVLLGRPRTRPRCTPTAASGTRPSPRTSSTAPAGSRTC